MKSLLFSLVFLNCKLWLTRSSYIENVCRHVCAKTGMCESSRQEISNFACSAHITRHEGSVHVGDKNSSTAEIVTEIQCLVEGFNAEKTLSPRCQLKCSSRAVAVRNDSNSVYNCSDDSVLYVCMHIDNSRKDKKRRGKGRQTKGGQGSTFHDHRSDGNRGLSEADGGEGNVRCKKYSVKKTWETALEQCRDDGGTLVKIDSHLKNRILTKKYAFFRSHWIGLKDLYDNDTFYWTDGEPLTFSKWQTDQPSHTDTEGKENCVARSVSFLNGQGWTDQPCDELYQFICEI